MRLIDADKLKSLMIEVLLHIKENPKMNGEERHLLAGMHMLGEMIDDAPTIEAVPVIRCKECKHWSKPHGWNGWCEHGIPAEAEDYCSWAERREE